MADNVDITPGTGKTIAGDDIGGGVIAQRVKPVWGPDGTGTDADLPTGLPTQAGYKEVTGSASANNTDLVSVDAAGYRWVMCQITGTWSGTITFQASVDGTNWVNILVNRPDSAQNAFGTATANNIYSAALPGRYFRARFTSYTSGTATATAGFSLHPAAVAAASTRMDTFNSFSTSDNNNWGTSFTVNATTGAWNGSGFDRARTAGSAKNTTGTGLLGAGVLGFDGTNYQALRMDTLGDAFVCAAPSAITGWTAFTYTALSNTAQGVRVGGGTCGGWSVYNPAAATTFLQLFNTISVTVGTTAPQYVIAVPAGTARDVEFTCGILSQVGFAVAATTTPTGSTAPATGLHLTILYR